MKIGEYLRGRSLITEDELQEALAEQKSCLSHCFLGDILIDHEVLSKEDFEKYLTEFLVKKGESLCHSECYLGDVLISSGVLTKEQLNECLQLQQKSDDKPLLGEILIDQNYLTTDELVNYLSNQRIIRSGVPNSEK